MHPSFPLLVNLLAGYDISRSIDDVHECGSKRSTLAASRFCLVTAGAPTPEGK